MIHQRIKHLRFLTAVVLLETIAAQPLAIAATVDPALAAMLHASPNTRAHAIILLRQEASLPGRQAIPDDTRRMQQRVMERVGSAHFKIGHQFQSIPALTGWVSAVGLARLAADPDVAAIGADEPVRGLLDSSVPFIRADVVQSLGYRGQGMTVAVLDTGIDTDHPDLSDDIAPGARHFLGGGANQGPGAEDDNGHGTAVSGIITSRGLVAPPGVAPDADILAVKVLASDGGGFLSDVARGVDYVVSVRGNYAHLCSINISIGSFALYDQCPCDNVSASAQLMASSIAAARNVGIPTFVAVLNDGICGAMTSPACVSAAVAVAHVYDPSSGSLCGEIPTPDLVPCEANRDECNQLAAPGVSISTCLIGGGAFSGTGSSFAAPHAAAVAALLRQKDILDCDALSADQLIQIMKKSGHETIDPCGFTPIPIRIDALAALNAVAIRGDQNADGLVNSSDIPGLVAVLQGASVPKPQFTAADVNCDGAVNGLDVAAFVDRLLP